MLTNPYTKWLWDGRRSLPVWAAAVAAVAALYGALWQSIDSAEMRDVLQTLPQGVLEAVGYGTQITPAGYLTAQVYGLVDGVVLLVFAVAGGANIIAGDEARGRLDLILVQPVGRVRLSLQRFAALMTAIVAINVTLALTLMAVGGITRLDDVGPAGFAAMAVQMSAFCIAFAAIAFGVGAVVGSHSVAVAVPAIVAVVAFVANGVLPQVNGLEWTQQLSAFHWLTGGSPLTSGVQWGHLGLMVGVAVLAVGLGAWRFTLRDIRL